MTPQEIRKQLAEIAKVAGERSYISMDIGPETFGDRKAVSICLYPYGLTKSEGYLRVSADDFAEALAAMREAWTDHQAAHRKTITKKMALAIIRITTELGQCSDAALRGEFDAAQVAGWGDDACELANTMAGRGPFTIKKAAKANAA